MESKSGAQGSTDDFQYKGIGVKVIPFQSHMRNASDSELSEEQLSFGNVNVPDSEYYKMTRPIVFWERLFGRMPIRIVSGWMRFNYKSWQFAYTVVAFIIYILLTIFNRETLIKAWSQLCRSEGITYETIMFSSLVVMQVPVIIIQLYSWVFELPEVAKCFNMTAIVEKRISDVFPTSVLAVRTKRIVTLAVALYFLVVWVVGNVLLASRFDQVPWFPIFTFVFCFLMAHSTCIAWCFNFLFIRSLAGRLKNHMVMCLKVEENRVSKLKICSKIWMAIWKLSRKYSDAFAITLLCVLVTNGVLFVISTYGLISTLRTGSFKEVVETVPYFLSSFVNVASVFEAAHLASDKVDRFLNMISYTGNARITLKGFVTVDRSLLVSFLSYSVTYLIVLIQFQGKSDESAHVFHGNESLT